MESIRCNACNALLFKTEPNAVAGRIEIKCRRCGHYNDLRPSEPEFKQIENETERTPPLT